MTRHAGALFDERPRRPLESWQRARGSSARVGADCAATVWAVRASRRTHKRRGDRRKEEGDRRQGEGEEEGGQVEGRAVFCLCRPFLVGRGSRSGPASHGAAVCLGVKRVLWLDTHFHLPIAQHPDVRIAQRQFDRFSLYRPDDAQREPHHGGVAVDADREVVHGRGVDLLIEGRRLRQFLRLVRSDAILVQCAMKSSSRMLSMNFTSPVWKAMFQRRSRSISVC